nr:MAG TPA: hypothetical protein [Caudoviricetes sp.]
MSICCTCTICLVQVQFFIQVFLCFSGIIQATKKEEYG